MSEWRPFIPDSEICDVGMAHAVVYKIGQFWNGYAQRELSPGWQITVTTNQRMIADVDRLKGNLIRAAELLNRFAESQKQCV